MPFYSSKFIDLFQIMFISIKGEFYNFYIKNWDVFDSLEEQSLHPFSCLKRKEYVTFVVVLSKQAV